jgi:thiamine kinase-like enzyme
VVADPELAAVIAAVPEWRTHEPTVTPIEAGRTNRNFRVEVGGAAFFLRLSDEDTALLGIDRTAEYEAAIDAAAAGVGPEVVAHLPEHRCLITGWVVGEPLAEGDMEQEGVLADVAHVVRTIHAGPRLPWSFDAFRIVEDYRRVARDRGVRIPEAFEPAHERAGRIEEAFANAPVPECPCHNDLLADNFLRGEAGFWLVDYEYAGMGDPFFDLGNLSINNGLSEGSQEALLGLMFDEVTDEHRARLQLMRIMSDFREAMWGVVQQGLSTLDIDYVAYADRHFDRLSRSMHDQHFEGWLEQASRPIAT